jgi:hypothetical protein
MGDTTIRQTAKQAKYFKNNLGVLLKFVKKIIEVINSITIPFHLIHHSNPIVKNDKYE